MYPLLIVLGNNGAKLNLFEKFMDIFKKHCHEFFGFSNENIEISPELPKFIIYANTAKQISTKGKVLIVCTEHCDKLPILNNCDDVTVILNSACELTLSNQQVEKCKFITYGFGAKDTVTLSSVNDERAVVSIQRGFETFSGKKVEPMEVLVDCSKGDEINMLAVVTALIYCEINI